MSNLDKIRAMFQSSAAVAQKATQRAADATIAPAVMAIYHIKRLATAKWHNKFTFQLQAGDGPEVGVDDAVFRFGKHKFATLKWVAMFKTMDGFSGRAPPAV